MKHIFILAIFVCAAPSCATRSPSLPFNTVQTSSGINYYFLSLPDSSRLMIRSGVSKSSKPQISSISYSTDSGVVLVDSFNDKQLYLSEPPFDDFTIWNRNKDGDFTRASTAEHRKVRKTQDMMKSFFEKHVGKGGSTEDAMHDLDELRKDVARLELIAKVSEDR